MKKLIMLFIALTSLLSCQNEIKGTANTDTLISDAAITTKQQVEEKSNDESWTYQEKEDKMTSQKSFFAFVKSPTELGFKFPYENSVSGLTIRKKRGETDIMLQVSSGQFKSDYDGTTIKARFDSDKAITFSCSSSSDGSSNVLFIDNVKKFMSNLKTHNKLVIEAEFYSEGLRQIEFNIQGLKWNH